MKSLKCLIIDDDIILLLSALMDVFQTSVLLIKTFEYIIYIYIFFLKIRKISGEQPILILMSKLYVNFEDFLGK